MDPKFNIPSKDASHLLAGLVAVNEAQLRRRFSTGKLDDPFFITRAIQNGTLRYKRADPSEHWMTWEELYRNVSNEKLSGTIAGGADCEDLAAAVVAELRFGGIPARTYVYKARPKLFHVVVYTDKWGFLDPSRAAGMHGNG